MAKELTKRQRYWLDQIRRATESGKTLKAYAECQGISPGVLYNAKSRLIKNGAWTPREELPVSDPAFVPVRIEPAPERPAFRLRHPSGWILECDYWPDPEWLLALVRRGGSDASA